jgi:hypothetical protein
MGWWGTGIMEGDSPMDEVGSLAAVCGVEYSEPSDDADGDGYVFTPEALNKNQNQLMKVADNNKYDGHITFQVWAYLVMKHGAEMTRLMKACFLSACDSDEWAQEGDEERQESISSFREKIEAYSGEAVDPKQRRGLFEAFVELDLL